jgi:hypothetical protein
MIVNTYRLLVNDSYYAHLEVTKRIFEGKPVYYVSSSSIPLTAINLSWRIIDWENATIEELIEDIEVITRKSGYVCFGTIHHEIRKLKIRDHFGILSDYTPAERSKLFRLYYSQEARKLTSACHFPLKSTDVSRQYPLGWEIYTNPETGKKKKIDIVKS